MGQDARYYLNVDKMKDMNWKQTISLESGIERMVDWVVSYPELLQMNTAYEHRL